MPTEFHEHLEFMARRIAKRAGRAAGLQAAAAKAGDPRHFAVYDWPRRCLHETPECGLWACLPRATANATLEKCCMEHQLLRDTALWVIKQLEANNIRYFLSTGTALGAIRHGGTIIPWDTDVDIVVWPEDEKRVEQVFARLSSDATPSAERHHFHRDNLGKGMFWVHASPDGLPVDGPHVEIFVEPVYTVKHEAELLPLERCDFYGTSVWCPNRKMFNVWFPSGWGTYSGAHYHNDGRCTMYIKGRRVNKKKC
jgi:hypothetical protein